MRHWGRLIVAMDGFSAGVCLFVHFAGLGCSILVGDSEAKLSNTRTRVCDLLHVNVFRRVSHITD